MSDQSSQRSYNGSLPSESSITEISNIDFEDENGIDIIYPVRSPAKNEDAIVSKTARVNPNITRIQNKIKDIMGDITSEYLDLLTDFIYSRHMGIHKKNEYKHMEAIKYIEKHI